MMIIDVSQTLGTLPWLPDVPICPISFRVKEKESTSIVMSLVLGNNSATRAANSVLPNVPTDPDFYRERGQHEHFPNAPST